MSIKIKVKLDDGAFMPERAHNTDSGYDLKIMKWEVGESYETLYSPQDEKPGLFASLCKLPVIRSFARPKYVMIDTGVHVQPEDGYWTMAVANSRTAKRPYWLGNGVGIIDQGYTGSIRFIYKVAPWATVGDISEYFSDGNVCGQLIVMKRYDADLEQVEELGDTKRGDGGFGSTEKKEG